MSVDLWIAAGAAYLLWRWNAKRNTHGNAEEAATTRLMDGIPKHGDTEAGWWEKFHGRDVVLKDYSNGVGGVNPDPGSVGRATIANSVSLAWNGDINA